MVAIDQFSEEICPLNELSVFRTFFSLLTGIHLILVHCFAIQRYWSGLSLVSIHWFLPKLWPLDFEKYHELSVFRTFFSLCLQIFIWYLVHCFAIPRYRSRLSLVSIHWFLPKLWPLDFEKYHELSVFRTFFSLLTDIHLIFVTLFWHTKLQIKFEFGFDSSEFHEVMAHGLRKILRIVSFLPFCSPLLALQSQII
jgi:hypothetical protein